MRAESVIYTLLTGDTGVTALVGTKIYPGRLPQNTVMPAISYEMVSGNEILPINAQAGGVLVRSRVQVTVLAKTYAETKAVHEAARKALLFKSGSISTAVGAVRVNAITRDSIGADERDDELGLYIQSVDYLLIHDET